jgi:hypothetical protein
MTASSRFWIADIHLPWTTVAVGQSPMTLGVSSYRIDT